MHDADGIGILIADGSRERRSGLSANFQADGYRVIVAPTLIGAVEILARERVALVLLESTLLEGQSLGVLAQMRRGRALGHQLDPDIPVIVLAAGQDDLTCIRTLDAGADDYVRRPASYMEIRARVGALLRRQTRSSRRVRLQVGPLEVDAVARQAWVAGEPIEMAGKEFSLLRVLASEPTRLFTRDELLQSVWGWAAGDVPSATTRTLDSHASRLRRKLRGHGLGYVINVWGQGYRLCDSAPAEAADDHRAAGRLIAFPRAV